MAMKMTEYQRAILDIECIYPNTAVGCIGGIMHLAADTDTDRFAAAAERFAKETAAIRQQLSSDGTVYISDRAEKIVFSDMDGDIYEYAERFIKEPFKLYDSPLYAQRAVKTETGYAVIFKLHHILGDHMSLINMIRRIEELYFARNAESCALFPKMPEYPADAEEYYKKRFAQFSPSPFAAVTNIESETLQRTLKNSEGIIGFCRDNGLRTESVIIAALALYIGKTKAQDKVVIGNTVMNRDRHSIFSFGLYANTVPMFTDTNGSFMSLCRNADFEARAALKYGAYPLRRILSDNGVKGRCFDVSITYMGSGMQPRFKLGKTEKISSGCCEIPLRLYIYMEKGSIKLDAEYISELFSHEYIKGLLDSTEHIIDCGIGGSGITAVSPADKAAYERLNDVPFKNAGTTVSRLFAAYAAAHPADTAYICNGMRVSYKKALMMAKSIARRVEGSAVVAVVMGRCVQLIPAIIGTLMAGAAYMPIAPGLDIPACCDKVLSLSAYGIEDAVELDRIEYTDTVLEDASMPDSAAYYMNTSGSAGAPKTVMIKNSSLYLRLLWMHEKYGLDKTVLQKTSLTFDVSGWELFACAFGGTAVLAPEGAEADPKIIAECINKYRIELIHFVPSVLRLFLDKLQGDCLTLTDIISSGEALRAADVKRAAEVLPGARLHNLYGPTECTIDVSYHDCKGGELEVPIGRPVYNTGLYVVNKECELMPRGVTGELMVTGDLVGMGYLSGGGGYTEFLGKPAYRTGDLCKLGFDGEIYYCGRADRQVKLGGRRIDLDGLERMSLETEGVKESAAVWDNGKIYLFCRGTKSADEIRIELSHVTDRMPTYIYTVEKMPVTAAGKLDRAALLRETERRACELPSTDAERDIYNAVLAELNSGGETVGALDVNEDIFNAGISSLSVLMLEQRLNKAGYDISARDIYIKRSVRALAGGGAGIKGGAVYLKRKGNGRALCCFTYAGAAPQSFAGIAKAFDGDVISVDYSWFGTAADAEEISASAARVLADYSEINIAAFCIGSVFAIETAYLLERDSKPLKAVYIMGSLPPQRAPLGNPWRRLPKSAVISMVSRLGGRRLPANFPIDRFLCDTDRYFGYKKKRTVKARAFTAYAAGDGFTKGFERKGKGWDKFFANKPTETVLNSDSHYIFEEREDILSVMSDN